MNIKAFLGVLALITLCILKTGTCVKRRRPARLCGTLNVTISSVQWKYDVTNFELNRNLIANISWNISNPQGVAIDGFLIRLKKTFSLTPIQPLTPCVPKTNYLWITGSECMDGSEYNDCSAEIAEVNTSSSCICFPNNCSTYGVISSKTCKTTLMKATQDQLTIVGSHVRFARFNVSFHEQYQFQAIPYYRQFYNEKETPTTTLGNFRCEDVFSSSGLLTPLQAVRTCCDLNIPHLKPLEISWNVSANTTSKTLTVTVTWLPPALQAKEFVFTATNVDNFSASIDLTSVQTYMNPKIPPELNASCYNASRGFRVLMKDLPRGTNVSFTIKSVYDAPTSSICRVNPSSVCSVQTIIRLSNDEIIDTKPTATTGCESDGTCVQTTETTTPDSNENNPCFLPRKCVEKATCMPSGARFTCTCKTGYRGDGKVDGTGCSHAATLRSSLYLTILLVLTLFFCM